MQTAMARSDRPPEPTPAELAKVRDDLTLKPLEAAPAELRHAVWRLWALHQHLFPSPLPLAAAVGLWVREFDLDERDAAAVLAALTSPAGMAKHRFAADLMTALAEAARFKIDERRAVARQAAQPKHEPLTPEEYAKARAFLDDFKAGIRTP